MTVQKEIQNTPINFVRVTTAATLQEDAIALEDLELNSVFQEDSRRQLFKAAGAVGGGASGADRHLKATAFQ